MKDDEKGQNASVLYIERTPSKISEFKQDLMICLYLSMWVVKPFPRHSSLEWLPVVEHLQMFFGLFSFF